MLTGIRQIQSNHIDLDPHSHCYWHIGKIKSCPVWLRKVRTVCFFWLNIKCTYFSFQTTLMYVKNSWYFSYSYRFSETFVTPCDTIQTILGQTYWLFWICFNSMMLLNIQKIQIWRRSGINSYCSETVYNVSASTLFTTLWGRLHIGWCNFNWPRLEWCNFHFQSDVM